MAQTAAIPPTNWPQFLSQYPQQKKNNIRWIRTTRKSRCPICQGYGWCEISDDGQQAHCMRTPSDRPMVHRQGGWLHNLVVIAPRPAAMPPRPVEAAEKIEPLPAATLDRINRRLLFYCPLTEAHTQYLKGQGVPPAGCGSLAYGQASKIARRLVEEFGEDIARRHPALTVYQAKDGRRWWTIAGAADGILFPAASIDGLVLGIQIRKDKPGKNDRYRWLSHDSLGGTPISVFKAPPGADSAHHLIITEGYKKAAVAVRTWHCHAISLAGVTAYKDSELIEAVEKLGVSSISLAFDADKREKKQVKEAEQRLLRALAVALPGRELYYLQWDGDRGKGLDDAVQSGAEFSFDPAVPSQGPRLVKDLPAETLARSFPALQPLYTLEEARRRHRQFFDQLLMNPDGSKTVLTSPTGTGKSRAADDAIAAIAQSGWLDLSDRRLLLLVPNKTNLVERTAPGTALHRAIRSGAVTIQQGRALIDLSDPGQVRSPFDCANPEAQEAGAARQITAKVICKDCPFGSQANWLKAGGQGERPFKCDEEGYVASRRASEKSRVVIATKESYFNGSKQIEGFDIIVCDEDLLTYLYEIIEISSETLAGWSEKITLKGLNLPDWEDLFKILARAFDLLERESSAASAGGDKEKKADRRQVDEGRLVPSRAVLEQAATELGMDLQDVIDGCNYTMPDRYEVYDFESPYQHNGKIKLPFRSGKELLEALQSQNEGSQPRFTRQGKSFKLVLYTPREKLIGTLQDKTVVVLDATLSPNLNYFLPGIRAVCYPVFQNLHIMQVTNALYTKRDLYNKKIRDQLSETIKAFADGTEKHLTIMPLRFQEGEEALEVPAGTLKGHWGLDERATSRFQDCDSLALVGHYIRPIDCITAETLMARNFAGQAAPAPAAPACEVSASQQKLRLYNHQLPNGSAAGRWMQCHQDPDVQAAIEHEYQANIVQAIGRLRAALRPAHLPPARVLILCNEPVGDLKIDVLTTADEIRTNPPKDQIFINRTHVKIDEKGGLVPSYTAVMEGRGVWDAGLIQDETAETQCLEDLERPPGPQLRL